VVSTLFVRDTKLVSGVTDISKMLWYEVYSGIRGSIHTGCSLYEPHIGLNQCKRDHLTS